MKNSSLLRAGDWVQVRSREEILATLDKQGQLEGLPFMPEMLDYCGQSFQVFKRAHKTCDPPNGLSGRRMLRTVHLDEVRCNGSAHGGCQARCLMFWKNSWLKRVNGGGRDSDEPQQGCSRNEQPEVKSRCTAEDVLARACSRSEPMTESGPTYVCQSTQIAQATEPLCWWDPRQYAEDYASGNVRLTQFAATALFILYETVASAGIGLGSAMRWMYDKVQNMRRRGAYPMRPGRIPRGVKTPSRRLHLNPGEMVKVRSHSEILDTLDEHAHNRGMYFDAEMVPYCGGTYRVLDRVEKIVDEKTGKMRYLRNDCIMLEGVVCRACYSKHRRFCPRSIHAYWREIWLERLRDSRGERL